MSAFEIIMLTCFGLSWPISIAKSLKTRKVADKSPVFMIVIIIGYIAGIIHKVLYSNDLVLWLYIANLFMVLADLAIYLYFMKINSISTGRGDLKNG